MEESLGRTRVTCPTVVREVPMHFLRGDEVEDEGEVQDEHEVREDEGEV